MFILAKGGETFARLQFNTGPGLSVDLAVDVDFTQPFPAANHGAWSEEYERCVTTLPDTSWGADKQRDARGLAELDNDRDSPWWWDEPWPDALERENDAALEGAYA
jgi:hypothetical protein